MSDAVLAPGPELLVIALAAALAGFVDAVVGGGGLVLVGSFFVFLFVRVLGYDFLHASASAKLLNTAPASCVACSSSSWRP